MMDFGYQKRVAKENYYKELQAISCRKKVYKAAKRSAMKGENSFEITLSEYEWDMLGKQPSKVIDEIAEAFGFIAGNAEAVPDQDYCMDYVIKFVK